MAKMEMPHNNIVTKMDSACFVSIKLNFTDSFLQPILAIAHWIIQNLIRPEVNISSGLIIDEIMDKTFF